MRLFILLFTLLNSFQFAMAESSSSRVLCYDRFDDEIWLMEGEKSDDVTCRAMLIAGTVGICFEGDGQEIVDQMNEGGFIYSGWQKVNEDSAELLSPDVIKYGSYEGDFVPWTRNDNHMFRCPEFNQIKNYTSQLADQLESTVDYAVSRRYFEEFGLPFWLKPKIK